MKRGALAITGIDPQRLPECSRRAGTVTELRPCLSQRKPSRCESRRCLDRLREQVGGGGKVAAGRQVAAESIAPVGDQVAR